MPEIYFEDLSEGTLGELGSYTVRRDEMVQFARQYDPQPIHTDDASASIIASGWYTAGICMRLLVKEFLNDTASMGARGLETLSWPRPVRPGDTLTVENEILETRPSERRNDRGYIRNRTRGYNQDGDEAVSWTATNVIARR